jgi:menaquinone-dependent protoporphyrinogen oxidase
MAKKVLIAYGSRYGSTEEIAHTIAETLKDIGLEAQLLDLRRTKQKQWPPLTSFDGILVGSGIRIGRWTKEAKAFLKKHADEFKALKALGLVVGVFVSSWTASIPGRHEEARRKYLEEVLAKVGIADCVATCEAFGGVYDLSSSAPMGFLDKRMASMGAKQMAQDIGTPLKEGARNDLRDWDQIRTFAERFAQLVREGDSG